MLVARMMIDDEVDADTEDDDGEDEGCLTLAGA